jgi:hypothetical protein
MSVTKYFSYVVGNSCALSVDSVADLNDFYFSNPVNDFVSIRSNVAIEKVEIYNLIGNMVLKTTENTDKIDVSNLAKGIYLISAYSGTEKCTKKIIIK